MRNKLEMSQELLLVQEGQLSGYPAIHPVNVHAHAGTACCVLSLLSPAILMYRCRLISC